MNVRLPVVSREIIELTIDVNEMMHNIIGEQYMQVRRSKLSEQLANEVETFRTKLLEISSKLELLKSDAIGGRLQALLDQQVVLSRSIDALEGSLLGEQATGT